MSTFKLPTEISIDNYPSPSTFIEEAISCVKDAEKEGILLRIMGGLAIYLHSQEFKELWERLARLGKRVFTDIDFASYGKFRIELIDFFTRKGYNFDRRLQMRYGKQRQIYFGGKVPMIEIFFDKLEMNHTINFNKRLEIDSPTLPLSELLLQKLQIVKINEKDVKDVIVLLRAHDLGKTDDDTINLNALCNAGLLSDWGFYYTVTTNLKKIVEYTHTSDVLTENDRKIVNDRANRLLNYLAEQPKSLNWKLRAKIGPKKKWYNDVEDWF
jgi:hypothetical protein